MAEVELAPAGDIPEELSAPLVPPEPASMPEPPAKTVDLELLPAAEREQPVIEMTISKLVAKPGTVGSKPTTPQAKPPLTSSPSGKQPVPPATAASGITSKLNSLKERRSNSSTPPAATPADTPAAAAAAAPVAAAPASAAASPRVTPAAANPPKAPASPTATPPIASAPSVQAEPKPVGVKAIATKVAEIKANKEANGGDGPPSQLPKALSAPPQGTKLPAVADKKLPSASPSRIRKPSPGPTRPSFREGGPDNGDSGSSNERGGLANSSPKRSVSPNSHWNFYTREPSRPKPQVAITAPSEQERLKRRQWAQEKRRKEEAKAREEMDRRVVEDQRKRADEEAKLEARRAAIRERIIKQHEIHNRMVQERMAAEERAKQELQKFRGKPLYEKLIEEYERNKKEEEVELKKRYEEEVAAMKMVRPHQIITGEVVIKPPINQQSPPRDARAVSGRSPARDKSPGRALSGPPAAGKASRPAAAVAAAGGQPASPRDAAATAAAAKARQDKPRTQGIVLYSTRAAKPLPPVLVERAVSPFVFNSEQRPINVPDQSQFWTGRSDGKAGKPQVLAVDSNLNTVLEDGDAPQMQSPTQAHAEMSGSLDELAMIEDETELAQQTAAADVRSKAQAAPTGQAAQGSASAGTAAVQQAADQTVPEPEPEVSVLEPEEPALDAEADMAAAEAVAPQEEDMPGSAVEMEAANAEAAEELEAPLLDAAEEAAAEQELAASADESEANAAPPDEQLEQAGQTENELNVEPSENAEPASTSAADDDATAADAAAVADAAAAEDADPAAGDAPEPEASEAVAGDEAGPEEDQEDEGEEVLQPAADEAPADGDELGADGGADAENGASDEVVANEDGDAAAVHAPEAEAEASNGKAGADSGEVAADGNEQ